MGYLKLVELFLKILLNSLLVGEYFNPSLIYEGKVSL
jgi:hypothetical protein